jgi:hypothetical protein
VRREGFAVLFAAALFGAAPAAAAAAREDDDFTPVVGGGSFNAAPILTPGRYRDTVLPEEYLYYGVRVQAGQRLHVVANAEIPGSDLSDLAIPFVAVNVAGPDRSQSYDVTGKASFVGSDEPAADFTTPAATTTAAEGGSTSGLWKGPGVYFVSVYALYAGSAEAPPKAEIPFHFELAVEGTAVREPAATPVATPRRTATPSASPPPAASSGGGGAGVVVAVGAGGLVLGALGGLVVRRRRD